MSNTPPIDPSGWGNSQPPTPQMPPPGWNGDPNPASQTSQPGWGQTPAPATGWGQTPPPGFYPPQGYAAGLQPGWAQAGVPVTPPKERNAWLIVLAVVLGLFFALIVAAVVWVAVATSREEGPSREIAEKFMVAVQDEDYRAASNLVCKGAELSTSTTGLRRDLLLRFGDGRVSGYTFSSFEWSTNGTNNEVTGIISSDGQLALVIVGVRKSEGNWCVDYVNKRSSVLP